MKELNASELKWGGLCYLAGRMAFLIVISHLSLLWLMTRVLFCQKWFSPTSDEWGNLSWRDCKQVCTGSHRTDPSEYTVWLFLEEIWWNVNLIFFRLIVLPLWLLKTNCLCVVSSTDTFEMVCEDEDSKLVFKVNYHYLSQVKNASDANSAARARRLAQEAVTLSTSLPLSSSSSVFVRCDEERLDIMKVWIDTPGPSTETLIFKKGHCWLLIISDRFRPHQYLNLG